MAADPRAGQAVHVFLRIKPEPPGTACCSVDLSAEGRVAVFRRPAASRVSEHHNEQYAFTFDTLLGEAASQEEVFRCLAEPVVQSALLGVNGTIFAYGQTGSGKTHTLSGSPESFEERGLLPRAIALVFRDIAACPRRKFRVHVSYMEVYNEVGYDLLDAERDVHTLADLPQVTVLEDAEGRFVCRNLSRHWVSGVEHAFNLLFLGATNRTISETPMNKASSRSHCIFTAHIESQEEGGETVRTSKLTLVDLAGSERVHRTRVDGITLHEAKHINLSLHHLEQVIVALQAQSDGDPAAHVPYRNSLLTMVRRDCIGGNCKTCMVANVTPAESQFEETLSTCRFAQRVACISYTATVNECVSPELVIANLRQQVAELQEEIQQLKGGEEAPISEVELRDFQHQLLSFISCADSGASPPVRLHRQLMTSALQHLRAAWQERWAGARPRSDVAPVGKGPPAVGVQANTAVPAAEKGHAQSLAKELAASQAHANGLLQKVNAAQAELQTLRAAVEKARLQGYLAAGGLQRGGPTEGEEPASVAADLARIEEVKLKYRSLLTELNDAKAAAGFLEQQLRACEGP